MIDLILEAVDAGKTWLKTSGDRLNLDLRLHQLAVHVSDRRSRQGHLKWSHLARVTPVHNPSALRS